MDSRYGKDVRLVAKVATQTGETVYMDPNLQTFFGNCVGGTLAISSMYKVT